MKKDNVKLDDSSIMWFGIHKGKSLANVPASYLLYLYESGKKLDSRLKYYIKDNLDVLKKDHDEEIKLRHKREEQNKMYQS